MAVYKVPQDVEADDKLLGPFSFRQFMYLIIAIMGVVLGWGLSRLLLPLAIVPLPIVVLFGALALPLRKDQPMEVYLAAVLSFYLKPRKRLWKADGIQSLVEIVVPKTVEENRTKALSEMEAEERLSYLANLVDSRGWAVRGVNTPQVDNAMQADVFFEAQQTEDVLDDSSSLTNAFNNMIGKADAKRRQEAMNIMNRPVVNAEIPATPDPYASIASPPQVPSPEATPEPVMFNPYPEAMRQSVISPARPPQAVVQPPQATSPSAAPTTSNQPVSPDIINLANNSDLSIETLAHEAKRIRQKEQGSSDGEVVISLR
jgi:hypothetical protein